MQGMSAWPVGPLALLKMGRQALNEAIILGNFLSTCQVDCSGQAQALWDRGEGGRGRSTQHPAHLTRSLVLGTYHGPGTPHSPAPTVSTFSGQKCPEDKCVGIPEALLPEVWGFRVWFSFSFSSL